jgi:hypothetical protein
MKKQKNEQPNFKDTPPLNKKIFNAFLKKAIESPKIGNYIQFYPNKQK